MNVESMKDTIPEGFSEPVSNLLVPAYGWDQNDVARISYGRWMGAGWQGHTKEENVFYSLRLDSDIYEKNKAMFDDEESTGHPHAESILEYAKDWAETRTPWKRWHFCYLGISSEWEKLTNHPAWTEDVQYKRIPTPQPTILINGIKVPEPVRKPLNDGERYFVTDLRRCYGSEWDDDSTDCKRFQSGMIHLTEEAAEIHRKALLSFTAKEEE